MIHWEDGRAGCRIEGWDWQTDGVAGRVGHSPPRRGGGCGGGNARAQRYRQVGSARSKQQEHNITENNTTQHKTQTYKRAVWDKRFSSNKAPCAVKWSRGLPPPPPPPPSTLLLHSPFPPYNTHLRGGPLNSIPDLQIYVAQFVHP